MNGLRIRAALVGGSGGLIRRRNVVRGEVRGGLAEDDVAIGRGEAEMFRVPAAGCIEPLDAERRRVAGADDLGDAADAGVGFARGVATAGAGCGSTAGAVGIRLFAACWASMRYAMQYFGGLRA